MNLNEPLKALSWKEPYATLMLHGKIETRSWNTNYRGLVLICSSKQPYSEHELFSISGEYQTGRIFSILNSGNKENPGCAIAIGRLVDSRPMTPSDEDKCFVKYRSELWCHVYEDVKPIKPMPWKGNQGWKNIPQEFINQIETHQPKSSV